MRFETLSTSYCLSDGLYSLRVVEYRFLLSLFGNYMRRNLGVGGVRNDLLGLQLRLHLVRPSSDNLVGVGITNSRNSRQLLFGRGIEIDQFVLGGFAG